MLKDSLPQFVREMKEMSELLKVDQSEINRLLCSIEDMIRQFYISSATYSIDDWEQEFSIEKNSTLTRNQRRAQLLGKLNTRTPATVKMLENLVLKTLGADKVEIREIPQEYRAVRISGGKYGYCGCSRIQSTSSTFGICVCESYSKRK